MGMMFLLMHSSPIVPFSRIPVNAQRAMLLVNHDRGAISSAVVTF